MKINDAASIACQFPAEAPLRIPELERGNTLPEDRITITGSIRRRHIFYSASSMAKMVFESPSTYAFRKAHDDHAVVYAGPFIDKDGAIHVLDFRTLLTYDGRSLKSEAVQHFETNAEGPDFSGAVFSPNGTCVFLSGDKHLKAFNGKKELFSLPLEDEPNSPVAANDSMIAYATKNGNVYVHSLDGSPKESYTVPVGDDEKWTSKARTENGERIETWIKQRLLFLDSRDRLYLMNSNHELTHLKDGAAAWTIKLGEIAPDQLTPGETLPGQFKRTLFESPDGKTMYFRGKSGLIAIDCDSGKLQWSADLGSPPTVSPVCDDKGNLYTLTLDGRISILSPEGKKLGGWDTGVKPDIVNSANPRLLFDSRGNLCVTPNPCHFHVYTADGDPIVKLKCGDLFREVDYIQDFTLAPDGKKAIILAGSYSIGEMELPCTSAQKYREALEKNELPEEKTAVIIQEEEYIIVGDVRLDTRKELGMLSPANLKVLSNRQSQRV